MRALTFIFALCVMTLPVHSQNAQSPHEGLRAELSTTPGNVSIRWWGKAGRTYFVQTSATLLPGSWSYLPDVRGGTDAVEAMGMLAPSDKLFVRLVYTDAAFTGNVGDADADGDGLSNAMEVSLSIRSNPLVPDTDGDGFTDGIEHQYGFSPTLASSNPELVANTRYLDISSASFSARHVVSQPQQGVNYWTRTKTYFGMPGLTSVPLQEFNYKPDYPAIPQLPTFTSLSFGAWQAFSFWDGNPVASGDNFYTNTSTLEKEDYAYVWSKMRVRAAAPSLRDRHYWLMLEKGAPGTASDGREFRHVVLPAGAMEAVVNIEMAKLNDSIKEIAARSLMDWEVEGRGQRGDFVPSVNGAAGEVHYVTPKWAQDIDGNNYKTVVVQARGLSHSDFTGSNAKYQWNCISEKTGLPAGAPSTTDASKFVINRETADHFTLNVVPVNPLTGITGKIHVWVVWANCTPTFKTAEWATQTRLLYTIPANPPLPEIPVTEDVGQKWYVPNRTDARHRFVFTINPASICDPAVQERPDLTGEKKKPVPGEQTTYSIVPSLGPADNATKKWDVSRQMKVTIRNPHGINNTLMSSQAGTNWYANANNPSGTPVPWPGDPTAGNDDPESLDEDDNPYAAKSGGDLDHAVGQLSSIDGPSLPVYKVWGGLFNITYGAEMNFREFCRLEIHDGARTTGKFWFRISDYKEWHHYMSAQWDGIYIWSPYTGLSSGSNHPTP